MKRKLITKKVLDLGAGLTLFQLAFGCLSMWVRLWVLLRCEKREGVCIPHLKIIWKSQIQIYDFKR